MFRMHTAHLANVSKSVTKNATFPRTGRLPCLITQQLHVSQLLGDSFSVSQRPPSRDACSHYSMHQAAFFLVYSYFRYGARTLVYYILVSHYLKS